MRKYPHQKRKIAICVLCLLAIVFICCMVFRKPGDMQDEPEPQGQTQQPEDGQDEPAGPGGLYTHDATAQDGEGELLHATWEVPDFSGSLEGESWDNVSAYYTDLQQQKQQRLEELEAQAQQQYDNLAGFMAYSLSETYEITRQDEAVLSVLRVSEEYLGGATAQSQWQADNFSAVDGSALTLEQVLREEATLSDLTSLVQQQMQQREQGEYFEDADVMAQEQYDPSHFYFTETGLVLFYPAYVLAPYSQGPQSFVLEYDDIAEYVQQEYLL